VAFESNGRPGAGHTARLRGLALTGARAAKRRLVCIDRAAIEALPAWRCPAGLAAAGVVSALAEPAVVAPLLAAAAVTAVGRNGWRAACLPALAVPAGMLARWRLSQVIARPRPPATAWLTRPEGYSLPSRHTTLAALTAGACLASAGTVGLPRHAAPLMAAAGVGASRVYLGVHWPTDVLAGWLFAEAWLGLGKWLRLTGSGRDHRCYRSGPAILTRARGTWPRGRPS